MENLNLCKILKNHKDKTFYSPIYGNLKLIEILETDSIVMFSYKHNCETKSVNLRADGKLFDYSDEAVVFPSKKQRDWKKWDRENNHKPPKTWSEFIKQYKHKAYILGKGVGEVNFTECGNTPIEKSALALLKIYQLIEVSYGGNITEQELIDSGNNNIIYYITYNHDIRKFVMNFLIGTQRNTIMFHTNIQAEEFLSYPENIQLLKDYFMIN